MSNREEEEKPLEKIPISNNTEYNLEKSLNLNTEEGRKGFSKIRGHNLLSGMILFLGCILIADFFWNNRQMLEKILEIFKVLIFTLSGYLFGKNERE
jgi:hypothetical protein